MRLRSSCASRTPVSAKAINVCAKSLLKTRKSIPKRVFSVNAAVVHCNKKPGPPIRLAGFLSASGSVLIAAAREATLEDFEQSR